MATSNVIFQCISPYVTLGTIAAANLTNKPSWWIPAVLIGATGPLTLIVLKPIDDALMAAQDGD